MKKTLAVLVIAAAAVLTPVQTFAQPPQLEEVVIVDYASGHRIDLPYTLLAQVEAPAPSTLQRLADLVLTPEGIAVVLTMLGTIIGLIFGARSLAFKRRLALGIYHAYQIVNDAVAEGLVAKGSKAQAGLQVLDEYMVRHGWRPLKPGEQAIAQLGFKSLHGEEKQKVKLAAEAQLLAERGALVP